MARRFFFTDADFIPNITGEEDIQVIQAHVEESLNSTFSAEVVLAFYTYTASIPTGAVAGSTDRVSECIEALRRNRVLLYANTTQDLVNGDDVTFLYQGWLRGTDSSTSEFTYTNAAGNILDPASREYEIPHWYGYCSEVQEIDRYSHNQELENNSTPSGSGSKWQSYSKISFKIQPFFARFKEHTDRQVFINLTPNEIVEHLTENTPIGLRATDAADANVNVQAGTVFDYLNQGSAGSVADFELVVDPSLERAANPNSLFDTKLRYYVQHEETNYQVLKRLLKLCGGFFIVESLVDFSLTGIRNIINSARERVTFYHHSFALTSNPIEYYVQFATSTIDQTSFNRLNPSYRPIPQKLAGIIRSPYTASHVGQDSFIDPGDAFHVTASISSQNKSSGTHTFVDYTPEAFIWNLATPPSASDLQSAYTIQNCEWELHQLYAENRTATYSTQAGMLDLARIYSIFQYENTVDQAQLGVSKLDYIVSGRKIRYFDTDPRHNAETGTTSANISISLSSHTLSREASYSAEFSLHPLVSDFGVDFSFYGFTSSKDYSRAIYFDPHDPHLSNPAPLSSFGFVCKPLAAAGTSGAYDIEDWIVEFPNEDPATGNTLIPHIYPIIPIGYKLVLAGATEFNYSVLDNAETNFIENITQLFSNTDSAGNAFATRPSANSYCLMRRSLNYASSDNSYGFGFYLKNGTRVIIDYLAGMPYLPHITGTTPYPFIDQSSYQEPLLNALPHEDYSIHSNTGNKIEFNISEDNATTLIKSRENLVTFDVDGNTVNVSQFSEVSLKGGNTSNNQYKITTTKPYQFISLRGSQKTTLTNMKKFNTWSKDSYFGFIDNISSESMELRGVFTTNPLKEIFLPPDLKRLDSEGKAFQIGDTGHSFQAGRLDFTQAYFLDNSNYTYTDNNPLAVTPLLKGNSEFDGLFHLERREGTSYSYHETTSITWLQDYSLYHYGPLSRSHFAQNAPSDESRAMSETSISNDQKQMFYGMQPNSNQVLYQFTNRFFLPHYNYVSQKYFKVVNNTSTSTVMGKRLINVLNSGSNMDYNLAASVKNLTVNLHDCNAHVIANRGFHLTDYRHMMYRSDVSTLENFYATLKMKIGLDDSINLALNFIVDAYVLRTLTSLGTNWNVGIVGEIRSANNTAKQTQISSGFIINELLSPVTGIAQMLTSLVSTSAAYTAQKVRNYSAGVNMQNSASGVVNSSVNMHM